MEGKAECVFNVDTAPKRSYEADMNLEEAVKDLLMYHNQCFREATEEQRMSWIYEKGNSNRINREIRSGNIFQVRVVEAEGYFSRCYFYVMGGSATLIKGGKNIAVPFIAQLKGVLERERKLGIKAPETVGDYILLKKQRQKVYRDKIVFQISRFWRTPVYDRIHKKARFE